MRAKIVAVGSTKWERFIRRWGVSFLIGEDTLFDTFGDSRVLLNNMKKFSIDTAKIKHIILSHDDWDHITGLWSLIQNRNDITVYICPGFKQEIKDRIHSFRVKVVEAAVITPIKDGVYSTGQLSGESDGRKIYEQSIVIETAVGAAVICGCAHPGVADIVRYVKESFHTNVCSLVGGFHLKDNTDADNRAIIEELKACGVRVIVPLHCTGKRAAAVMREVFGPGFVRIREGFNVEL